MEFAPLKHPDQWPPSEDEPGRTRSRWGIRGLRRWFHEVLYGTKQEQIRYDIERQICDQLNARPEASPWPSDPTQRQIVQSLATAVRQEKEHALAHVTPHPDDPIVLLLWGCYDDLTPLVFRMQLESAFDVSIPTDTWKDLLLIGRDDWHRDQRTVGILVEQCVQLLTAEVPNRRKAR